jgi:hypothetical protein
MSRSFSSNRNPHQYAFYATKRLHLAAYIKASNLLEFSHTERAADGKCLFVFHDERREGGETFERAYERGGEVVARNLFAAQAFLKREIDSVNQKNGVYQNHVNQSRQQ